MIPANSGSSSTTHSQPAPAVASKLQQVPLALMQSNTICHITDLAVAQEHTLERHLPATMQHCKERALIRYSIEALLLQQQQQ
jgi:hypothetical protein